MTTGSNWYSFTRESTAAPDTLWKLPINEISLTPEPPDQQPLWQRVFVGDFLDSLSYAAQAAKTIERFSDYVRQDNSQAEAEFDLFLNPVHKEGSETL